SSMATISSCVWPAARSFRVLTFFFSSRRRHTRFSRDWSSDVCSSDLMPVLSVTADEARDLRHGKRLVGQRDRLTASDVAAIDPRSEERRVGKECRYGRSPYQ